MTIRLDVFCLPTFEVSHWMWPCVREICASG